MDPATATGMIRVAIIGDDGAADIALPTTTPIRALIPQIRATLATGREDSDTNGLDEPIRPYSLAPLAGTPFSLDATLGALGIPDGEPLMLRMLPPGPAAPPIVEDLADAAAIHSARQFATFNHALLGPAAQVAFIAVGALITALATYSWYRLHTWWPVAALAGCALVFIVATALTARRGATAASGLLTLATPVPLALTLGLAVALLQHMSGAAGSVAPQVLAGAGATLAWSLYVSLLTSQRVATHTTIIAVSTATLVAAGARSFWHLPYLTLGCLVLAMSLYAAHHAPIAAAVWARFPMPNVPPPGVSPPAPPSLQALESLPAKVARSHAHQSGLIAASVLLAAAGAVMVLWLPDRPGPLCWWLVAATVIVTVLRARIWESAAAAMWFVASPLLTTAALTVSFAATGYLAAGWAASGIVVALAAALVVIAVVKPRTPSTPQLRYLDLFENILLFTLLPAMLWLSGIVSLIRNWGSI